MYVCTYAKNTSCWRSSRKRRVLPTRLSPGAPASRLAIILNISSVKQVTKLVRPLLSFAVCFSHRPSGWQTLYTSSVVRSRQVRSDEGQGYVGQVIVAGQDHWIGSAGGGQGQARTGHGGIRVGHLVDATEIQGASKKVSQIYTSAIS